MICKTNRHFYGLRHNVLLSVAEDDNKIIVRSFTPDWRKEDLDYTDHEYAFHTVDRIAPPFRITDANPIIVDGAKFGFPDNSFWLKSEAYLEKDDNDLNGGALGYGEWSDDSMFLFPIKDGYLSAPYNLTVEGSLTKARTMRTMQLMQSDAVLQIYVPFKTCSMREAVKSFYLNESLGIQTKIDLGECVTKEYAVAGTAKKYLSFMKVDAPKKIGVNSMATITLYITDVNGEHVTDCSPEVFIDMISGYAPQTRVVANNGIAKFKVMAFAMEHGEKLRFKVGYKHYSGMDDVTLEVV